MNSFISWIGGKRLLRNKILDEFPNKGTYDRYIEVFGGAGWVLFGAEDRHTELEVYNDINGNLVNLFKCVKYHPEALQKELEFIFMSREQFFDAKSQMETKGLTDIQKATRLVLFVIPTSIMSITSRLRASPIDTGPRTPIDTPPVSLSLNANTCPNVLTSIQSLHTSL